MHPHEMNQRAHERASRRARAEALREAAREMFDLEDPRFVLAAKWLQERAGQLEAAP